MHPERSSRSFDSARMRSSISACHALDIPAQSSGVGVRPSGSAASAAAIRSSEMPRLCAALITDTRRSVARGYRRWFPSVRCELISPMLS
jgi:hypothetical protein